MDATVKLMRPVGISLSCANLALQKLENFKWQPVIWLFYLISIPLQKKVFKKKSQVRYGSPVCPSPHLPLLLYSDLIKYSCNLFCFFLK